MDVHGEKSPVSRTFKVLTAMFGFASIALLLLYLHLAPLHVSKVQRAIISLTRKTYFKEEGDKTLENHPDTDIKFTNATLSAFIPSTNLLKLSQNSGLKKHSGLTLLNYNPLEISAKMSVVQKLDKLISLAMQPQALCRDWRLFGDRADGGWPVCLAPILRPALPCIVYSYGISNDWSFDEAYHREFNCTMRTFDPSMHYKDGFVKSAGVLFYPLGLSDRRINTASMWRLYTHRQLLLLFDTVNITLPYLKMDIESFEFDAIHKMIDDKVLQNVKQLSFEVHVKNPIDPKDPQTMGNIDSMFSALKRLENIGFRRWFYHQRLNGFPFQCDQSFININFL